VSERGDRASDKLASFVGSWRFVLLQSIFLAIWFAVNMMVKVLAWDPYPFILANLFMSAEAAFTAPIIMMSQNRAANADRRTLQSDLSTDEQSLEILKRIEEKLK
jgi:uncharacterized membrane protein